MSKKNAVQGPVVIKILFSDLYSTFIIHMYHRNFFFVKFNKPNFALSDTHTKKLLLLCVLLLLLQNTHINIESLHFIQFIYLFTYKKFIFLPFSPTRSRFAYNCCIVENIKKNKFYFKQIYGLLLFY